MACSTRRSRRGWRPTRHHAAVSIQAWIDRNMSRVSASLKAMSRGLGEKPWCAGLHMSLGDIAVGCALFYLDFRFSHIDWRGEHTNLARLAEKLAARKSFIDTVPTP
jgi:glutathione S-transferase